MRTDHTATPAVTWEGVDGFRSARPGDLDGDRFPGGAGQVGERCKGIGGAVPELGKGIAGQVRAGGMPSEEVDVGDRDGHRPPGADPLRAFIGRVEVDGVEPECFGQLGPDSGGGYGPTTSHCP